MSSTAAFDPQLQSSRPKGLHIGLWVVQVLLALLFLMAGFTKATQPLEELAKNMPWVSGSPAWMPRLAGISEVLAALGLILPSVTRIKPMLTVAAAGGLVLVMLLASALHLSRGELGVIPVNAVLGLLAAFVAWGRATKAPIPPRS